MGRVFNFAQISQLGVEPVGLGTSVLARYGYARSIAHLASEIRLIDAPLAAHSHQLVGETPLLPSIEARIRAVGRHRRAPSRRSRDQPASCQDRAPEPVDQSSLCNIDHFPNLKLGR